MDELLNRYDSWLDGKSEAAALTLRRWLVPVEGRDAVIFPPTYPIDNDKAGYNIDHFDDGSNICQIDSIGSQANRMEIIFMREPYSNLIPRVIINAKIANREKRINILEAGHRAADAVVRFSTLGPQLYEAFERIRDTGDVTTLARIAPTSIIFGVWDSRATQVKIPRIIRSVIRASNVQKISRSAQYSTIAGEILEGPEVEIATEGVKSELGLTHVPAVRTHGGVQVTGEIRQEAALNFVAIRSLFAGDEKEQTTIELRRYILGLALLCFTVRQDFSLREGCHLIPDETHAEEWKLVKHDGNRESFSMTHTQSMEYATEAAKAFGVNDSTIDGEFDVLLANQVQSLSREKRKLLLRQGPVTRAAIERIKREKTKGD